MCGRDSNNRNGSPGAQILSVTHRVSPARSSAERTHAGGVAARKQERGRRGRCIYRRRPVEGTGCHEAGGTARREGRRSASSMSRTVTVSRHRERRCHPRHRRAEGTARTARGCGLGSAPATDAGAEHRDRAAGSTDGRRLGRVPVGGNLHLRPGRPAQKPSTRAVPRPKDYEFHDALP